VGGEVPLKADVRVVCATNRDIFLMAEKGDFRRDLLYRINVIALKLPPLRERRKDIHLLAEKFLRQISIKYNKRIEKFSESVLAEMEEYAWPGNVRELLHSIEHAVAKSKGSVVKKIEFGGERLMAKWNPPSVDELLGYDLAEMKTEILERYEKEYLDRILLQEAGSLNRASRKCGIDRKTLYRKMRHYGLDKKDYR
jgi:DNA-binding NtrC family response regulator